MNSCGPEDGSPSDRIAAALYCARSGSVAIVLMYHVTYGEQIDPNNVKVRSYSESQFRFTVMTYEKVTVGEGASFS